MRNRIVIPLAVGVLLVLTLGADTPGTDRAADVAAVKKSTRSLARSLQSGDARAVAAHWTESGEYFAEDGTTLHGRSAIEAAYRAAFEKKKTRVDGKVETTSIRFPSRDTAIEEGFFTAHRGSDSPLTTKFSIFHVREDGQWRMAVVREWPSEGLSVHDLEWLIGTWTATNPSAEIRTTYEWWGNKTFLRAHITLKQKGKISEGFQMIGKDAATGQLRAWTFDKDGSFGEATWSHDGKKWTMDFEGVLADGSTLTSTNIITRIDNDSFTFQSVERSLDGEAIADIPPVRVTRVRSK